MAIETRILELDSATVRAADSSSIDTQRQERSNKMPTSLESTASTSAARVDFDAIVIGAGFAGLYMLHRLRQLGLSARVYERGGGVGGTWYWNRYPGARCDTESVTYSYSFSEPLEQEWVWTERYATQPEILRYADHVADRFDLRSDIQLETSVQSAVYDEANSYWQVRTDRDEQVTARFVISAMGCLSAAALPDYPGLSDFSGELHHTGQWPHEPIDFSGKRVGIIGTGSSGVQSTTAIAPQAAHLFVFQRTPNYSVPAWNGPLEPATLDAHKANYREWRAASRYAQIGIPFESNDKSAKAVPPKERERDFEAAWADGGFNFVMAYPDLLTDLESNRTAADFVARKIREKVDDPATAASLIPNDHPIGTKRMCVDTGYYETFNRDNVTLVDIRKSELTHITANGVQTTDGHYELDMLIFATGFDAITGPLLKLDIRGRDGVRLQDKWADGPRTYLGLASAGFPNFFMITGPGSPCVLSNMLMSIEQHVEWIGECIQHMHERGAVHVEAAAEAERDWVQTVHEVGHTTLYPMTKSWYTGTNIDGKIRMFTPYAGGVGTYREICEDVVANGYTGFVFGDADPQSQQVPELTATQDPRR
ncbi:MAG: cyclohexanone monooxygenase [Gammaproteobacteria bacterium]|jgi:cyclohexanone monooxygenase